MVIPFQPRQDVLPGMPEPFDPLPYARRNIDMEADTYLGEIVEAQTVDRCLEIAELLKDHILNLTCLQTSALERANTLCGGKKDS